VGAVTATHPCRGEYICGRLEKEIGLEEKFKDQAGIQERPERGIQRYSRWYRKRGRGRERAKAKNYDGTLSLIKN